MQTRRQFIVAVSTGVATLVAVRGAGALQVTQNFAGPMEQGAYRPVKLAPIAGAKPSMTDEKRDDLEHQIKCQCGCVLDVYTCRTTDFSCSVSPAMHGDVMTLVEGGHDGTQILAAFQSVYGEQILMAPLKRGFNLVGYALPSVALVTGGVIVAGLIRKWGSRERQLLAAPAGPTISATDDEMAALNAAVRDDS
ncbi:MAG TPA: cytochrome c-type biogenesis protein CcmH [Gemmatimonadaceae bacterium]|nr:cytochrome c-type biogenesis protein CcmH [Gemmatimonadaceae bacterium]